MAPRRGGCLARLGLSDDNARFILLAIIMIIYMLLGAFVFHYLEHKEEEEVRKSFWKHYNQFKRKYNNTVDMSLVDQLMYEFSNASASGYVNKRPRWDYSGSFYFVGTVVSTIGFGMTTPRTTAGKLLVIVFGFFGCSGAILFFNLFLERVITFLAYVLRTFHIRELKRRGAISSNDKRSEDGVVLSGRRGSRVSVDEALENWKPSVYWVLFILSMAAFVVAFSASGVFSSFEGWDFIEAIYYCFITFSTIGFGDFVSSQKSTYENNYWYRFGNFLFLVIGCSIIYSLFNVMSIIIKQFLNWLISKLDFQRCRCKCRRRKPTIERVRQRRNAITPDHLRKHTDEVDRRNSDEMISMRDFLHVNKVSLAVMQKQLYETAQRGRTGPYVPPLVQPRNTDGGTLKPGTIGPLAIVENKLRDDNS